MLLLWISSAMMATFRIAGTATKTGHISTFCHDDLPSNKADHDSDAH